MATSSESRAAGTTPPTTQAPTTPHTFIYSHAVGFSAMERREIPANLRWAPTPAFYRALITLKVLVPEESSGLIVQHLSGTMEILAGLEQRVIQEFLTALG